MGTRRFSRQASRATAAVMSEFLERRTLLSVDISLDSDAGIKNFYLKLSGTNLEIFQNQPPTASPARGSH